MSIEIENVIALRKAFDTVKAGQKDNVFPDIQERKKKLRAAREACVGNEEVLKRTIEALRKNGMKVHIAKTKEDSLNIVLKEIGDARLIVKSKSNVTKEIGLVEEMEKRGVEVTETDIGDRIAQLLDTTPSHPTGPIAHLSAKEIAKALREEHGIAISENADDIVEYIKENIAKSLKKAKIGITGANAVTAEEGSILIIHNEGNIYETMRKEKHIVITGIDKLYPNIEEAVNMIKILTYNATGSLIPSFIEVISGVSKTADVEKKFFLGVHNPKEVVVVFLDNKRSEIINNGFKELLYCVGCGNCLLYCPVYNVMGSEYAHDSFLGGKGLAYYSIYSGEKNKKLEFCLTCTHCEDCCPVGIDIPNIIRRLRSKNLSSEVYYFLKSHILWLYYNLYIRAYKLYKKD